MTDLEDSPHDGQRLDAIRRALGLAAGVEAWSLRSPK